jgi:hypothetical protein
MTERRKELLFRAILQSMYSNVEKCLSLEDVSIFATTDKPIVIVGDLNFHLDIPTDRDTSKFNRCLETFGMEQHVRAPTHVAEHTSCFSRTRDLLYSISVGEKLTTPCFVHRTTKPSLGEGNKVEIV